MKCVYKRHQTAEHPMMLFCQAALSDLYAYMYCMMVSSALVDMPILGGGTVYVRSSCHGILQRMHTTAA